MSGNLYGIYSKIPPRAQNILVSLYGYHLYNRRYTGIYKNIVDEIIHVKKSSKNEIDALQQERLHTLVKYCIENIPYYQKIFSEYNLTSQNITSISDLKKLPILNKQILRENIHLFRPLKKKKPFTVQNTSGSTGTPLALDVNEYTYKLAMALLVDHEESHGVPFRSRRATFAGRMIQPLNNLTPPFSRFNRAENQRLFSSYHLNSKSFPYYRKELDDFKPEEIIGYPSAISELATYYLEEDIQPQFQPKAIVTNSETLLNWQKERIERAFQCPVYDYYGTAEYVIFAGQDEFGIYRTNPLIGICEIVNDSKNTDEGRVIATTLCNYAMPLIRYDLGDTAISTNSEDDPPGVKSITQFSGRKDDYILTVDGRKIGRIDHIFKGVLGIREAQIVQDSPHHCSIHLVKSGNDFKESLLIENFKQRIGADMSLDIIYEKTIPRGKNGKFKAVVGLK